ncbi:MAG: hypothetical protein LUQ22_06660 [Methanotrichaceae archaeon]|nr:hypothetical protein [Methanotrichaceae archaeon]
MPNIRLSSSIIFLMIFVFYSANVQALETFSGDVISIDTPIDDDIFAAGNIVNINAPVNSATIAGSTLNINAPIKEDIYAAGGHVFLNSDVGGKVVIGGGNVNVRSDIDTNLVALGGQVNILPGSTVGRDAFLAGGNVVNSGKVNGTLTVSSNNFANMGSAGRVDLRQMERPLEKRHDSREWFSFFGLLITLGYLILGLILLRYTPGLFAAVDGEIRGSPIIKTLLGFVSMIAVFIALVMVGITVIGLPIAIIGALLLVVTLMLTGIFVSFSLGKWVGDSIHLKYGDIILFIMGFIILNVLFHVPYVGGLLALISLSLGFGAVLYAARNRLGSKAIAKSVP